MPLKDTTKNYGWISIGFHWICALIILFLFGLGVYMRGLDYYSPWYHRGPEIHIAFGILVFILMSLRLSWRLKYKSPEPLPDQKPLIILAANLVKLGLYALFFVIAISGYLVTTAEGKGAYFFDFFTVPAITELTPDQSDWAEFIHKASAWSLVGLVCLHAGAALWHHFVLRDKTLQRMLKTNL